MNARKVIAALALTVVPFAGVMGIAAHNANAEPNNGGGGTAKGCPMEVDGKTVIVPVGTTAGIFHCGSDGEWHFGWFTTDRAAPPTTKPPVKTTAVTATKAGQAKALAR